MNKVSFGVAFIVSALVVGCQDSNFNTPVSNDFSKTGSSIAKRARANADDTIQLQQQLTINEATVEAIDNTYDVSGAIVYSLQLSEITGLYTLSLAVDANVQSLALNSSPSKIISETSEQLDIPSKRSISLEKVYPFAGYDRPLELHVSYIVSEVLVDVESIRIIDPNPAHSSARNAR